jgi:hypothetical protein
MSLGIAISAVVLWFLLVEVVKHVHGVVNERWEAGVWADYREDEDAYHHRRHLEEIEMARQATAGELSRAAHEARGEVAQDKAAEIEPYRGVSL